MVSVTGARNELNCGFVLPNRGLTSYLNRFSVLSKPRTWSSVGSTKLNCPQPLRSFCPCSSRSAAPSGLETEKLSVVRCGMRTFIGLSEMLRFAFDVHGPRQELRDAIEPTCLTRHSLAGPDPVSRSDRIALATAGSLARAGLNTKARSFVQPSPLTSPEMMGVNGAPLRNWPNQLTRTASKKL